MSDCIYGFREDFKGFSRNKLMEAIDPQGVASFDPRSCIGRIMKGPLEITTHQYKKGPHGFRMFFPIISLWQLVPIHQPKNLM